MPTGYSQEQTNLHHLHTLAQKRLHFFIGKGGVGKTTVAAAFALASAARGKKTLLIEFDAHTPAARLLGLPSQSRSLGKPRPFSSSLSVMATTGQAALEEYLSRILPFAPLRTLMLQSQLYQYFVLAAPGLKELMAMGKVWHEAQQQDRRTAFPRWDALIIDMPASGHSLQYLRMPQAAADTFDTGEVRRKAAQVVQLFRDPEQSAIHIVSLPEELPVEETVEIVEQIENKLRFPLGALFINQCRTTPCDCATLERLYPARDATAADRSLVDHMLAVAEYEARLTQAQTAYMNQLALLAPPAIATIALPCCFAESLGLPEVQELSHCIQSALHP